MSTPRTVNTTDGLCWTRREATRDGQELYALEAVAGCPAHLMETYAELEERGIAGSADVLPVPVGPLPRTLDVVEDELTGVSLSLYEEELLTERLRWALASAKRGRARLRARVAALLEERHSTNESVSEAAEALRVQRDRIAEDGCSCPPAAHPHQVGCLLDEAREGEPTDVQCSKCGDPVHWVKSTNSDGGFWRHRFIPGRVLDHFGEVAGSEGCHPFEAEYQGESDAKRRLPNCKACGRPATHAAHDGDVRPQVRELRNLLAGQRAAIEDPHDSPLHHPYRLGHDLPVPESCRLDAAGLDEVGRHFSGGGA